MSDSIFSKIIKREIPATIYFEDEDFIVIKDIYPKAPVHVLLIPKKVYASLEAVDLNDDLFYAKLLKLARQMAKKLQIADNYKLFMNVGDQVQAIPHLHLHLMGGWQHKQAALFNE
jgi:histidine triad (HIT) family protein